MILKQFVFLQNDFIFTQNNKISVFLSRKKKFNHHIKSKLCTTNIYNILTELIKFRLNYKCFKRKLKA